MARIVLTAHLVQQAGGREFQVTGSTVREVLESLFSLCPKLRGYVLEDHGTLRHHVVVFVNNAVVRNKDLLNDPVPPGGEVFLLQALSGGQ